MKLTPRSLLAPLYVAALASGLCMATTGCKKEEPPPPLPSAPPAASTAMLELKAVDAGVEDIDAGKPRRTGKGGSRNPLKACCAALAQNANLAVEPTKTYMLQAAAICNAAAGAGQGFGSVGGMISGALKGAQMPAACK